MPIVQQGSINTTAIVVPDLYVQIVPPQNLVINGVPSNRIGAVGTAAWGPVGVPAIVATYADYQRSFGALQARRFDMGTQVATAVLQGAQDFRCVRVTDGTDTAAVAQFQTGAGTSNVGLAARYTGTAGNTIQAMLQPGSAANSWRLLVVSAVLGSEAFDNIPGPSAATPAAYQAFWARLVAAINTGSGVLRGPSQMVVGVMGDANPFTAPATITIGLSTGSDGAGGVLTAGLVGTDTLPRRGMFALRGQGCSIGVLADMDDATLWTTVDQFGLSEGIYMMQPVASGTGTAAAVTAKQTAGLDSYATKLLAGDWVYWMDTVTATLRLVSPQGFAAGRLANLSPEQSSLNKPLYGVAGTQRSGLPGSGQFFSYSGAELTALGQAGIDVVANPMPGGSFWGMRFGHNASSNPAMSGDNYTRLTNYIASTLNASMGLYIGQIINLDLFRRVRSTGLGFLGNLLQQGVLSTLDGSLPFSVVCDGSNNPFTRTSLGYLQMDVQVRYGAIAEKFIVNLEGGQTVQVTRQTLPDQRV